MTLLKCGKCEGYYLKGKPCHPTIVVDEPEPEKERTQLFRCERCGEHYNEVHATLPMSFTVRLHGGKLIFWDPDHDPDGHAWDLSEMISRPVCPECDAPWEPDYQPSYLILVEVDECPHFWVVESYWNYRWCRVCGEEEHGTLSFAD